MARIRSVHPGQWTDDSFVMCSFPARLLTIGLRNEADDNGIFEWNPIKIKMRIFPADNLDITELLNEITENNQVKRFEISGKAYGMIRNFQKWQKPKSPSFLHPTPLNLKDFGNGYELSKGYSGKPGELFGNPDAEGGGRREEGEEEEGNGGKPPGRTAFRKPSLPELVAAFSGKVPDPQLEAEKFLNFYESKGWMVGKNRMQSWPHAVGNWCKNVERAPTGDDARFYQ